MRKSILFLIGLSLAPLGCSQSDKRSQKDLNQNTVELLADQTTSPEAETSLATDDEASLENDELKGALNEEPGLGELDEEVAEDATPATPVVELSTDSISPVITEAITVSALPPVPESPAPKIINPEVASPETEEFDTPNTGVDSPFVGTDSPAALEAPAAETLPPVDTASFTPEQNLNEDLAADVSIALERTAETSEAPVAPQIEAEAALSIRENVYTYLLHNDLRDVAKDDLNLQDTSKDILMTIKENTNLFSGADTVYYMDKDEYGNSHDQGSLDYSTPLGPEGRILSDSHNKPFFKISERRTERRKNVILSVTYEKIVKTSQGTYEMDLMLFMHSDSIQNDPAGYIFRFIKVSVDRVNKNPNISKINSRGDRVNISSVTFNRVLKEIPLSETDFEVRVELSTQKGLFLDRNHGILKTFPITAGAIDSRTLKDTSDVNSMTLLLPGREIKYKDFELKDTVLVKRSEWFNSRWNTSERIRDAGYRGRPFIALIDRSLMPKNEDGSLKTYKMENRDGGRVFSLENQEPISDPQGAPFYNDGYRQIGFHYKIVKKDLKRGFESHGCIRLQDHDLYTLDAIVNSGPKKLVPVEVKMVLSDFQNLDSIYTRSNDYRKVLYTNNNEPRNFTVYCKNGKSYPVRSFNGRDGARYHTLQENGCFTKIAYAGESVAHLTEVLTGQSDAVISTRLAATAEEAAHDDIRTRMEAIRNNENYVLAIRNSSTPTTDVRAYIQSLTAFGSNSADNRRLQLEQISLVEKINTCIANPALESCIATALPPRSTRPDQRWIRLGLTILPINNDHRNDVGRSAARRYLRNLKRKAFRPYNANCAGRLNPEEPLNCSIWLNAIKAYTDYPNGTPLVNLDTL